MTKISLVGAGNIGGELASLISSKNLGDIVLIDVVSGLAKGKALDLSQSGSVRNFSHSISGGSALSLMKDSDSATKLHEAIKSGKLTDPISKKIFDFDLVLDVHANGVVFLGGRSRA